MNFFSAIAQGLKGYDLLVVVLLIINIGFVAIRLRTLSKQLDNHLKKVVYLPVAEALKAVATEKPEAANLHKLRHMREKEDRLYYSFVSITSILPLLGILGTVIALMQIDGFTTETISQNFMAALTSTFWGLVGATLCKALEASIVARVEANRENFAMLVKTTIKGEKK
ncbi:MAG: MotA/TolQ/ExbB proton channel family protein [Eubacteriales bacterium]